jgi:YidC/Oxa1 family membrane protein insertase
MDRNSVIGLLVIGVILMLFTLWNSPDTKQREQVQQENSITDSQKASTIKNQDTLNKDLSGSKLSSGKKDLQKSFENREKELADSLGVFSKVIEGKKKFYTLENDVVKITFVNQGAKPYSVELKKFKTYDKKPLILFEGDSTIFGLNFDLPNTHLVSTNNLFFQAENNDTNTVVSSKDTAGILTFKLKIDEEKYIEYVYKLKPSSYMIDFKIYLVNLDDIIAQNTSALNFNWKQLIPCLEMVKSTENTYTSIYYKYNQDEVEKFDISAKDVETSKPLTNKIKWVAYTQQFFSSVIIAGNAFDYANLKSSNILDSSRYLKTFNCDMAIAYEKKSNQTIALSLYYGPNHYRSLKKFHLDLEELAFMGKWRIIKWINRLLIIPVFNFLGNFISSYGLIIFLLTIFIKIVLYPLTYKSYLSMAKMRVLKPQIDEINEKIPASKAMERQQATMALYKKAGVNPLGGCLPMLLQMPILVAMFRFFPTSIELRQQGFLWATDLSSYDSIFSWQTQIPIISQYFGNHVSLFNLLMTVTTIITIRMNNQANASPQMPGMKTMSYMMPVMFMFILNNFSSALTYYYFLTNVITIIQNEIFKRSIDESKLLHQLNENKKKPVKKSKFQEKLEEAARRKGYNTRR